MVALVPLQAFAAVLVVSQALQVACRSLFRQPLRIAVSAADIPSPLLAVVVVAMRPAKAVSHIFRVRRQAAAGVVVAVENLAKG